MAKPAFRPTYLSLSDAVKHIRSQDDLLAALREGTLRARGRLTTDFTAGADGEFGSPTEPSYGDPEPIPVSAWRDLKDVQNLDLDRNMLQDDQAHIAYANIEILKADLDAVFPAAQASGGRPVEHDWELILKQAMVWISQHPIAKGTTLDGWIKELAVKLPYCETHDVPKEDALKNKLRDVYQAIVNGQPLPVGKPKRNRL